jgi:hypothetical protein
MGMLSMEKTKILNSINGRNRSISGLDALLPALKHKRFPTVIYNSNFQKKGFYQRKLESIE